jgi:hypothetical protein
MHDRGEAKARVSAHSAYLDHFPGFFHDSRVIAKNLDLTSNAPNAPKATVELRPLLRMEFFVLPLQKELKQRLKQ